LTIIPCSEFLGADLDRAFNKLSRRVATGSVAGERVDGTLSREVGFDVVFVQVETGRVGISAAYWCD
jgi:hypothetical protein